MTKQDIFDKLKEILGESLYYNYVFYLRVFKKAELLAMLRSVEQLRRIGPDSRDTAGALAREYSLRRDY